MTTIQIEFVPVSDDKQAHIIMLSDGSEGLQGFAGSMEESLQQGLQKTIRTEKFKGKLGKALHITGLMHDSFERLSLIGTKADEHKEPETGTEGHFLALGGYIMAAVDKRRPAVSVLLDDPHLSARNCADVAMGAFLRAYEFDRYKSKKDDDDEDKATSITLRLHVNDCDACQKAWGLLRPVAEGVCLARDLINEPANILGPVEFAEKARELEEQGCEVEILEPEAMEKLGMRALLGVAQGAERPARLAIIHWNGAGGDHAPVAFVGKGVVFDTGGISIKPAAGMEDMKGDMGGAAAVLGLMHALSGRKARVNAIGVLGLVENMPDGKAQRPGDIVIAMNGKTIEIINTDAEGRLVLADALHYTNDRFKPQAMINLATLTGAIIVALGHEYAGLYSNDDSLAEGLLKAGQKTGDKLWRMPLGKAYDKMIESKFADIKNSGGRWAGSITAAQFLQHFVGDTPWAHLDIAGTAFTSPETPVSKGWASGFGVRGLDQYVRDVFESGAFAEE
jgi:leucyl aminopeptidase